MMIFWPKHKRVSRKRPVWRNIRPMTILLVVPIILFGLTVTVLTTDVRAYILASHGNERLRTDGWQEAAEIMRGVQPDYARKWAYYAIKPGQTVEEVADFFGVDVKQIRQDNPILTAAIRRCDHRVYSVRSIGTGVCRRRLIAGVTVKIRPTAKQLQPVRPNGRIDRAIIVEDGDLLRVQNEYGLDRPITTDIDGLMDLLRGYKAIERTGPGTYRLNRAISIEGDIRVDLTSPDLSKLELTSTPDVLASLVFDQSSVLIKGISITSVDPSTGKPDLDSPDGRAFVRMKNGRMDVIDSKLSYLGNGLKETLSAKAKVSTAQQEGGTYGFSYRISKGKLGTEISTGWVEGSTFEHNHFGAYSFGASGIMWKDNIFRKNEVYGLDPHDDSNNAMIVGNLFDSNGKHGFIVSKRCNYNVIHDNVSVNNKLHGFMLHQDSAYNLIEDNVSYGNTDNFVIYGSNWNTVKDNVSYSPRSSHIRINSNTSNTFVTGNTMTGGDRGVYLYADVDSTFVADNVFQGFSETIQTAGASNTFFGSNVEEAVNYDIQSGDTVIYGVNKIRSSRVEIPTRRAVTAAAKAAK
jgi:Periplasmic copper-binding protein (NosD)